MLPHILRVGSVFLRGAPERPLYEAVKVKSEMLKKGDICQRGPHTGNGTIPGNKAGEVDLPEPFETEVPNTRAM